MIPFTPSPRTGKTNIDDRCQNSGYLWMDGEGYSQLRKDTRELCEVPGISHNKIQQAKAMSQI